MQIFFLPGMDGTGDLFEPLIRELGSELELRVISYPHDVALSYGQLVDVVRAQLPEEKAFILVAESFSGPIGYVIASDAPDNLKGVVFLATFLGPPNRVVRLINRLPLALLFRMPLPTILVKWFLLGWGATEALVTAFRRSLGRVTAEVLASRVSEMSRLKGGTVPVTVPCAYISPTKDRLVPRDRVNEFLEVAPGIEVVAIEGPHCIAQTRPRECAEVIKRYAFMASAQK
ncbi:MAG: lysophospholipase [Chromatiales bacterium]|nr:lysophospholipase [Chromatiales bacterium]